MGNNSTSMDHYGRYNKGVTQTVTTVSTTTNNPTWNVGGSITVPTAHAFGTTYIGDPHYSVSGGVNLCGFSESPSESDRVRWKNGE